MARTIIQPIGPLYGEAVNGTVFGRPNGSIYIPETNQISISGGGEYIKNRVGWGSSPYYLALTNNAGTSDGPGCNIVAKSQDNAAYIVLEISDSSDFDSTNHATRTYAAGIFNIPNVVSVGQKDLFTIVNGTSYYFRARLVAASGVDVAVSDTIELTGVVPA